MRPVIGIPLSLDDRERWKPQRRYLYLDHIYANAVERAGGTPMLLPVQGDPAALTRRIDGLMLPGGDDFLPETPYEESVEFDPVPAMQLDFDRALLEAALASDRPVLGICYGAQLLALQHAGRLHHHLPIDRPNGEAHRLPEADGRHLVLAEPDTLLRELLGQSEVAVNSLHHQAIAEPGSGLRISARASDGVVEAVEATDGSFTLGVQWHPERLAGPAGDGLIAALVAASSRG